MQVNIISNQNFKGSFLQTKSLKTLRKTLCSADNSVLDKQFKLMEKVKDGKVFGYETFPKNEDGNSSRIYELVKYHGKEYKLTKFSAPKEDYHFLFNSLHNEYKYKLVTGIHLDING